MEESLLKKLKCKFSLLGYSVYMKGNTLQVSQPSRNVSKKELRSYLRGEFNKFSVSQQDAGRFTYVDIEE